MTPEQAQLIDELCSTPEDEQALLEYIFENSSNKAAREDFVQANISYLDALDIVQSNDNYPIDAEDFLLNHGSSCNDYSFIDRFVQAVETSSTIERLSYFLAYSSPELATKLLEELIHYLKKGRI